MYYKESLSGSLCPFSFNDEAPERPTKHSGQPVGASDSLQAHIKKHKKQYFSKARLSGRVAEDTHEGGVVRPSSSQISGISTREVWNVIFNPLDT